MGGKRGVGIRSRTANAHLTTLGFRPALLADRDFIDGTDARDTDQGLDELRRFIGRSGGSRNDGRRLGWLAFSCSSVAIPGHPQTEHVHSDRDWNDCGVSL